MGWLERTRGALDAGCSHTRAGTRLRLRCGAAAASWDGVRDDGKARTWREKKMVGGTRSDVMHANTSIEQQ